MDELAAAPSSTVECLGPEAASGLRVRAAPLSSACLIVFVLVTVVSACIAVYRVHRYRDILWGPDGAVYLRMALQDRGFSADRAASISNSFMLTTSEKTIQGRAVFYTNRPPEYYRRMVALFLNRPVYPALSSLFLPRLGPHALNVVSGLDYFVATIVILFILFHFASPWIAALGALGFATAPPVLNFTGAALTDELALSFWVSAIAALLLQLRRPSWPALLSFGAASLALTFTRPAAYLPFGAALGAYVVTVARGERRRGAAAAVLVAAGIGIVFLVYTVASHGAGIVEQLRWQYFWLHQVHGLFANRSFAFWWAMSVAFAFGMELVWDTYENGAFFALILAFFGVVLARRSVVVPVAAGTAVATLGALLVNPVELERTVTLPLTPFAVILATIALQRLGDTLRMRRPQPQVRSDVTGC